MTRGTATAKKREGLIAGRVIHNASVGDSWTEKKGTVASWRRTAGTKKKKKKQNNNYTALINLVGRK